MLWWTYLFWLAIAGIFYTYAGYPLLVGMLARIAPRRPRKSPNDLSVSVLISCYNESHRLAAKVANILSIAGSGRIRQVLIGSDGSEEESAAPLPPDARIERIDFPSRRGKPSVLNDLLPLARGDILVMMDVRQRLDEGALEALLENFSDPSIGVVSGEMEFERDQGDTTAAGGIDAYWRYEKWIREREARFASVPGATGALYAIRRELARPIPPGAALDDVLIPMQAIARGYRCIFEPAAKMYDRPAQDSAREAVRKRRTLAGNVQLMRYHPGWLLPGGHPIWWQFISHKIARLFSPWLLLLAFVANLALLAQPFYAFTMLLQLAIYAAGFLARPEAKGPAGKLAGFIRVFLVMQGTLLRAWADGLTRTNLALWDKA